MGVGARRIALDRLFKRHGCVHRKTTRSRRSSRPIRSIDRENARIPRACVPRRSIDARSFGHPPAFRVSELLMPNLAFDIAHLLAGSLVLVSFMMLYQDRLPALINVFALHAVLLSASVTKQTKKQSKPELY